MGAFGLGGSKSSSKSSQESFVDPTQQGYLQNMYGNAQNLWGDQQQNFGQMQNQANWASPYMQNIAQGAMPAWYQQLGGGATAATSAAVNPALQQSLQESMTGPSNMGQMYQSIVGGEGNTYIDPMVDAMRSGVQQGMERNVLPGIDAGAVGAGQSGSSRHGIAQGLAMSDANQQMMDQETQMRGGAYDKDLEWKMKIAGLADTNVGAAQDRAIDMMNQQNLSQQYGMKQGAGMQNLGMGGMAPQMQAGMYPWQMMGQYANTIGAPTILGKGSSKGKSASLGGSIG